MVQKNVSVCIFFPGLPDCLSKMCVVMTGYIFMLPTHNFFFWVLLCVHVRTQNLCLGIIHLFLKKTKGRQEKIIWTRLLWKKLVPKSFCTISNEEDPFADFMPFFWGGSGAEFSFIHSFIHCAISPILAPKENRNVFFAYESGVQFSSISMHLCPCKFCNMPFPRQTPTQSSPILRLFPWDEHLFWKVAQRVPTKFPNVFSSLRKKKFWPKRNLHNWYPSCGNIQKMCPNFIAFVRELSRV